MRWFNDHKIRLVLVGFVAAIVLGDGTVRADFIFGEPTNLGPTVNSADYDESPYISADGLSLYFNSILPGGHGQFDIWVTKRETTEGEWGEPVNLGPRINTGSREQAPCISADGLELFFASNRSTGNVTFDIWVSTRETTDDEWDNPVKLGPNINSSLIEYATSISSDRLSLFFGSDRGGGSGGADLWVTTRDTINHSWKEPVNLGSTVNSSANDAYPSISADGRTLFFSGWSMVE